VKTHRGLTRSWALFYLIFLICFLLTFPTCTTSEQPSAPTQPELSPTIVSATDYLKSISDGLYEMYAKFGIDEDVADYVLFISSLPKDFGDYTLQNKLCIQDHKLTDLEKLFLEEPDKHLQRMFDSYTSEISAVDPNLPDKLKLIPFFREIEIKDVEALEDITSLASRVEYKATLEKIYGKGIKRTMHPVALEKLVWDCYSNELDEPDLSIHSRLADFQEKYNKQMDETEVVEGKKPLLLGINYVYEPMGWLQKSDDDVRFDYALMRWVLGANAVKIWGQNFATLGKLKLADHLELAHAEGLEVWLEYCPVYALEMTNPDISAEDYCYNLAQFAQEAEKAEVEVLVVGHEVDLHLKRFSNDTGELRKAVLEMLQTARQNYPGLVTYCTWSDPRGSTKVNWELTDIVFPQLYKSDCTRELTDKEYLDAILKWKNKIPGKPLAISEFGSLTISDAQVIGPCDYLVKGRTVTCNPNTQATLVDKQLQVLFKADIYGVFLHIWDEQELVSIHGWDRNKLGFGIWDYKSQEPKQSFWSVYKYYRER
jgi:hypothetical protein